MPRLETFRDRIQKRRIELGFVPKANCRRTVVDKTTIYNWERNATSPQLSQLPAVIQSFGYDALRHPVALGERLLAARKVLGITQKEMAERLNIDPTTLSRMEQGRVQRPILETVCKVRRLVKM